MEFVWTEDKENKYKMDNENGFVLCAGSYTVKTESFYRLQRYSKSTAAAIKWVTFFSAGGAY